MTPRSQHVRKGVHPDPLLARCPTLELDVPSGHACLCEVFGNGLHQVEGVLLLPETTVDEHDAGYAFVFLKGRGLLGHVKVGDLPCLCAPLNSVNRHRSRSVREGAVQVHQCFRSSGAVASKVAWEEHGFPHVLGTG